MVASGDLVCNTAAAGSIMLSSKIPLALCAAEWTACLLLFLVVLILLLAFGVIALR